MTAWRGTLPLFRRCAKSPKAVSVPPLLKRCCRMRERKDEPTTTFRSEGRTGVLCLWGRVCRGGHDQYSAGADYARGVKDSDGKVIGGFTPEAVLPNYTANPTERGYYGGVTTPSTNLDNPGNKALAESEAGKAITESILNNPKDPISPDAPFIFAGSEAKEKAESVTDGSFEGCEAQQVSKTEYTSHICERDRK